MRRHAFRPAGLDTLEGRLAPASIAPTDLVASQASSTPATIYASNVNSTAAQQARAAHLAHARAVAKANAHSKNSIDWHKVGDQVKNFFNFNHHSHTTATNRTTNNAFRRA